MMLTPIAPIVSVFVLTRSYAIGWIEETGAFYIPLILPTGMKLFVSAHQFLTETHGIVAPLHLEVLESSAEVTEGRGGEGGIGRKKGFGLIRYHTTSDAENAIEMLNGVDGGEGG